jgi:KEOPS complex subunit Cgi121
MEYNIQIAGFKSKIDDVGDVIATTKDLDCTIQLLNAQGIAGRDHAMHAAIHALKAFQREENIAQDLGLEICVRASGQRQISQALNLLGIKEGNMDICTVSIGCNDDLMEKLEDILGIRDDSVLEPDYETLKKMYHLSDVEIETTGSVSRVLMERTALLMLES